MTWTEVWWIITPVNTVMRWKHLIATWQIPKLRDRGTALYFKGFSLRAMGRHEEALIAWNELIDKYPDHAYWVQAWEFKAYSLWFYLGRYSEASQCTAEFCPEQSISTPGGRVPV